MCSLIVTLLYIEKASLILYSIAEAITTRTIYWGDDEEELEGNALNHTIVCQAGHGQSVARAHYTIDGKFLNRLGAPLIKVFE